MANHGTSNKIKITGESFTVLRGFKLSAVDGRDIEALPPKPNGTLPSEAMYIFQNPYPDFAFSKVSPPDFGVSVNCAARITGLPANNPDYIADFHYIGLMRCIDKMLEHNYVGVIKGNYTTPSSK